MDKLKKTARGLDIFFKILFWAFAVFAVIFLAAGIFLAVGGSIKPENIVMFYSINGVKFNVENIPNSGYMPQFIILALMCVVICALALYGIKIIRGMLAPMKEGRPFSSAVSNGFKRLGWLSIIVGIIQLVMTAISQSVLVELVISLAPEESMIVGTQHTYDMTFIPVAALLFLFSFIYKYGEELQQLSDETL